MNLINIYLLVWSLLCGFLCGEDQEPGSCCGTFTTLKQLASQEIKITALEQKIVKLEAALEQKTVSFNDALEGLLANSRCGNAAFRAQLTKDLGTVTRGQTIIFDHVELNIGNAYHPYHGVFTAPCSGTYLFSVKIGNKNRYGALHLKKNNVTVEYVWAGFNTGWDMGGVATVVNLIAGDDVWVAGRDIITGTSGNDGIGDYKHVAFAGTLLHAFPSSSN